MNPTPIQATFQVQAPRPSRPASRAQGGTGGADGHQEAVAGQLEGLDDEGRVLFRAEGQEGSPIPVTIGLAATDAEIVRAARNRSRALVVRTLGPTPRWVLVGLMRERVSSAARDASPGDLELIVDGEKVLVTAMKEIRLKCGKASLVLMENGRVEIRGTYLLSASRGANKIKGATIALN